MKKLLLSLALFCTAMQTHTMMRQGFVKLNQSALVVRTLNSTSSMIVLKGVRNKSNYYMNRLNDYSHELIRNASKIHRRTEYGGKIFNSLMNRYFLVSISLISTLSIFRLMKTERKEDIFIESVDLNNQFLN